MLLCRMDGTARPSTLAATCKTEYFMSVESRMSNFLRLSLISATFALLFANTFTFAFAYGEIDTTFKPDGIANANCGPGVQAVVANGSIYTFIVQNAPYQTLVVRHAADGRLDKAWGSGGLVSVPKDVKQLLPAADGGLFVIGGHISRYRQDGTLDPSYGSFGNSDVIVPSGRYLAMAIVQSDGSVVVLTYAYPFDGYVFVRTNPRGIRDTNFGLGGYFSIPVSAVNLDVDLYAWSIEADGSVQLALSKPKPGVPRQFQFEIKRFRKDLTVDPGFDAGGRLVPRQGVADWLSPTVKVQADGGLVMVTSDCLDAFCEEPVLAARRYDALGNVDSGFGEGGKTIFRLLPNERDSRSYAHTTALWLGPDGNLTLLMRAQRQFGSFGISATGTLAYRLNADGTLDKTFENAKVILNQQDGDFLQLDDGRLLRPGYVDGGCAPIKYLTDTPRTAAAVVEYFSPSLNHYFMTAHEFEKDFVERGLAGDWKRTGQIFGAFSIEAPMPGTSPVCRFYGGANGGPNSHFYSAEKFECDILARIEAQTPPDQPAWRFEREAFRITVPASGICPPNLTPLYRLYNRAGEPGRDRDPNHRYTTDLGIHAEMQAQGWVSEGVHMCMPPASRSDRMPN